MTHISEPGPIPNQVTHISEPGPIPNQVTHISELLNRRLPLIFVNPLARHSL